jgi:hypothetical protein
LVNKEKMQTNSALQSIDTSTLTPIVRASLKRAAFTIQNWHMSQLGGGVGNPVSVGLYRFEGWGQDQGERIAWSVILKILQSPANEGLTDMGEGDDQSHWNYWRREPLIYQSGLLETLPNGMAAPRCFGVVDQPGNMVWLWLEDITDSNKEGWSLERYALTACHLGQLNGIYISQRSLPSFPWLSTNRTKSWLALIPWQTIPWDHSRVLERYPRPTVNSFRRMLAENERFLAALERIPKTICHGDTYPTNFIARQLPEGQQQTVALDWALAGIAPVGDDLGQLVFGAQANLKEANPTDVDKVLFESYLDGLRDSGCRIDPQLVRFGYTASAAFRVGLFQLFMLSEELMQSDNKIKQVAERSPVSDCFEVVMADEAYQLLDGIG